jgi:hypothetical protein
MLHQIVACVMSELETKLTDLDEDPNIFRWINQIFQTILHFQKHQFIFHHSENIMQ